MYRTTRKTFVADDSGEGRVSFSMPKGGMVQRVWLTGRESITADVLIKLGVADEYQVGNYDLSAVQSPGLDVSPRSVLSFDYTGAVEDHEYELCIEVAEGRIWHYAVELGPEGEGEAFTMAGYFEHSHGGFFMTLWYESSDSGDINPRVTMVARGGNPGRDTDFFNQGAVSPLEVNYGNWELAPPGTFKVDAPDADPNESYTVHCYIFDGGAVG